MYSFRPIHRFSSRFSFQPPSPHITSLLTNLSKLPQSLNLYQGIPNLPPPSFFQSSLTTRLSTPLTHQYSRSYGHLDLVKKLAQIYSPFFQRTIDPLTEVLVVPGSSAGVFAGIQGLLNPEETAIVFEPNERFYSEKIALHKGKCVELSLVTEDGDWRIDYSVLDESLRTNPTARLIIISSPQSPIGKVFSAKELEDLMIVLRKYPDVNVLFDASFEKIILDEKVKTQGIQNNEFWERCATVFSADKAFCSTGLNLAWVMGHPKVLDRVKYVHNISTFCMYSPMQLALADALTVAEEKYENEANYYSFVNKIMRRNLEKIMEAMGKNVIFKTCKKEEQILPKGGYSMFYDISNAAFGNIPNRDQMISMGISVEKEILIHPGSFYISEKNEKLKGKYIKIDLCRSEEEVQEVCARLGRKDSIL